MSVRGATSCGKSLCGSRGKGEKIGGDLPGVRHTPDASSTVPPGNDRYERSADLAPTRTQTAAISLARAARSSQESVCKPGDRSPPKPENVANPPVSSRPALPPPETAP